LKRLNLNPNKISKKALSEMTTEQLNKEKKRVKEELKFYDETF
jgi:hypothetical protein